MYNISYIFGTDLQYFLDFRNWCTIFPIFLELIYNISYIFGTDLQYFLYFRNWYAIFPIFTELICNISYIFVTDKQNFLYFGPVFQLWLWISCERVMLGSTVGPLWTLFKLVWPNVFEKLSEPKSFNRQDTGCHKVRRRYRHFRQ